MTTYKGSFRIDAPERLEATLTFTMTIGDWIALKNALTGVVLPVAADHFRNEIRRMIDQPTKDIHVYGTVGEADAPTEGE